MSEYSNDDLLSRCIYQKTKDLESEIAALKRENEGMKKYLEHHLSMLEDDVVLARMTLEKIKDEESDEYREANHHFLGCCIAVDEVKEALHEKREQQG